MHVLTLTRDKWKTFKEKNNLSKSSFFSKADVGPHIDSFQKALEDCKKSPGQKSLMAAFSKGETLNKAFEKFIGLKEAKDELKPDAKKQLETWRGELSAMVQGLAKLYKSSEKDLQAGDTKNLNSQLDQFVFK
ncbi:MAG TPA: hypothetical protein VHX65_19085 [Pirellulales bacterium]|jgi:hypothetical protein|nr:hypothetical protein [Pirellulales bacterium]